MNIISKKIAIIALLLGMVLITMTLWFGLVAWQNHDERQHLPEGWHTLMDDVQNVRANHKNDANKMRETSKRLQKILQSCPVNNRQSCELAMAYDLSRHRYFPKAEILASYLYRGVIEQYIRSQPIEKKKELVDIITRHAKSGISAAQGNLGLMYANGNLVEKSNKKALYWFEKAIEKDNPIALTNMAIAYSQGTIVPKDEQKASEYMRRSAKQGEENARTAVWYGM
ncbi:sel1 repeat family protein [Wielerella bovis]|uniref:tetratricopeptide repeat protein n=1 Tax=Wielerella bovis TaxID=2917790 RepID=UPI002018A576|nr:tetratricopeptide repeat protein [Wielerella bovis]ULJ70248.1 sel1 repeat family protein [Wielerella bovis]